MEPTRERGFDFFVAFFVVVVVVRFRGRGGAWRSEARLVFCESRSGFVSYVSRTFLSATARGKESESIIMALKR